MTALVDASGVALELAQPPRRIVSLLPSTTETLCRLGLSDALVGVTAYCVEPREVSARRRGAHQAGGDTTMTPTPSAARVARLELTLACVHH